MYGGPLVPSFRMLLAPFDRIFSSTLLLYQREILYQVLEYVLVVIDTVLRNLKYY